MSVVPLYLRLLDDLTPASLFDQDFGLGIFDNDLLQSRRLARHPLHHRLYLQPWAQRSSAVSNLTNSKDEFKVNLDVQQFKPDEISVKVVDNFVIIDGKHEERQDEHGYITREFKRRYLLPDDVDPAAVVSSLSSDGVLSVQAPKKQALTGNERSVPINFTQQPAIKEGEAKNTKENDKMEQ